MLIVLFSNLSFITDCTLEDTINRRIFSYAPGRWKIIRISNRSFSSEHVATV